MSLKPDLKLDWCSHEAAKFAVMNWHYSKSLPVAKSNSIGVWEDGKFIGALLFSWGANPNIGKPYGLKMVQCSELVRVALNKHRSSVSRIIKIAIKMVSLKSPGLKLLISYADTGHGHHGGIYQAGNWVYTGITNKKFDLFLKGKLLQRRAYTGKNFGRARMKVPDGAIKKESPPKHRYLMPLDKETRKRLEGLAKPYPKKVASKA